MAMIFRKKYTMPVPATAELTEGPGGRRVARWKTRGGRWQTAEVISGVDGRARVRGQSAVYMARFKDAAGRVVEVSTNCRDEGAARQVLAELVKRAERVRAGLLTAAEDAVVAHGTTTLNRHIADYLEHLRSKRISGRKVSANHVRNVEHNLRRISRECSFQRLADLSRRAFERWLDQRETEGMSARTRNAHQSALTAFANWCVGTHRLTSNPFHRLEKANEKSDRRRPRRALTEAEMTRLLEVARCRPLQDALTIRRGKRMGQQVATLTDATRRRLERLGHERALIYKTLLLTGLRKGELASLTIGQLELDLRPGAVSFAVLDPHDEKSGRGAEIPLRSDLVADLLGWLGVRLKLEQDEARARRGPIPSRLPPETPLFKVPDGLIRIFDLDLVAAGLAKRVLRNGKWVIDKRDDRGRTIDVHALRHTFGTHLSRGGVAPRTAQAAMRHSTIELTMNTYTDPRLLDVAGALEALPSLPLERRRDEGNRQVATAGGRSVQPDQVAAARTDVVAWDRLVEHPAARPVGGAAAAAPAPTRTPPAADPAPSLAPALALPGGRVCHKQSAPGQIAARGAADPRPRTRRARGARVATWPRESAPVNVSQEKRATGLEPATFSLEG